MQIPGSLSRLNSDGTPDTSFQTVAVDAVLQAFVQKDGKIVVDGHFEVRPGFDERLLARFHSNGERDEAFNPPAIPWQFWHGWASAVTGT